MGLFNALDKLPFCMTFMMAAVRPDNQIRLSWDLYILCLVIYSSVWGPYKTAFDTSPSMSVFDWVVDFSFYADIVLAFWTGYDQGFEVIMEKRMIVTNYLSARRLSLAPRAAPGRHRQPLLTSDRVCVLPAGWFFIDLIATIQWDMIFEVFDYQSDSPLIRMMRLLKTLRLLRTGRLLARLTANFSLHTQYTETLKFFFYVFMVAHLLASFFYLWPTLWICPYDPLAAVLPVPGIPDCGLEGVDGCTPSHEEVAAWQLGADGGPSPEEVLGLQDGAGWYWSGTCMLGSWRQGGPEQICSLLVEDQSHPHRDAQGYVRSEFWTNGTGVIDAAAMETLHQCYVAAATTSNHMVHRPDFGPEGKSVGEVCRKCMPPPRLYIDALYFSLTTMTTIGYGDRGPGSTEEEILFVIAAEVSGLAIFALLL